MERLIKKEKMKEKERQGHAEFLKKAEWQIDLLDDGATIYFDFDETIVVHDEEGRMVLNPLMLEVVDKAKESDNKFKFALLTSTPRFVWNEGIAFPQVLIDENVRRRPYLELFEEAADIKISEEIYADEQIDSKSVEIEKERLEELFGGNLKETAEKMYESLLLMQASPLDEETVELVERMKTERFPPQDIINLLLNSAVKLRYLIVEKNNKGSYRYKNLNELLVFDDKRAGAAGEALSNKNGSTMGLLVPRRPEERESYEEVMCWEDIVLKTYSALFRFGVAPQLSPSRVHVNESDTEVFVGAKARRLKNTLTLISLLESLSSEKFAEDTEGFYQHLIDQSEELGKERIFVNIILPGSEALVKLDLARLLDLSVNENEAKRLQEAIETLAETLILSIEKTPESDPVHQVLSESLKDKILSKVYIGYKIGD